MKKFLFAFLLFITFGKWITSCGENSPIPATPPSTEEEPSPSQPQPQPWVGGADISWYTEMAADGRKFYNAEGKEQSCPGLMKDLGLQAIRLRVWIEASTPYHQLTDVVQKAIAAHEQKLDIMIDFHFSDFFADPSRQHTPSSWSQLSITELTEAVSQHTRQVLTTLKTAGVNPRWVQIGNETHNGMLWPTGQLWDEKGDRPGGWQRYVTLSNACHQVVKEVSPQAITIVHLNNAHEDHSWWLQRFKAEGGKFDMIGLSHYPQEAAYHSQDLSSWKTANDQALLQMKRLANLFQVPIMICETGVWNSSPEEGYQVLADFIQRSRTLPHCAGVFYWEPQVYADWKPAIYETLGWKSYHMGAFTSQGRPSVIMDAFR